jgi:hypothetical protein
LRRHWQPETALFSQGIRPSQKGFFAKLSILDQHFKEIEKTKKGAYAPPLHQLLRFFQGLNMRPKDLVRAANMGIEPACQNAVGDNYDVHAGAFLSKTAAHFSQVGHEFLVLQAVSLKLRKFVFKHEAFFSPEMQADITVKKGKDLAHSLHSPALMTGMDQFINLPEQFLMLIVDFLNAN